jgi:hypothetical protein
MVLPRRFFRTVLAIAFALLAALVVIAEIAQGGQKEIDGRIGLSQKRQILLSELLEQVAQAEAGQRGYLLTGDEKYLNPYQSARDRVEPTLDQLGNLYRDSNDRVLASEEQRNALRHVRLLIGAKLAELSASLELYATRGPEQATDLVRTDISSSTMNDIRAAAATLREGERTEVNAEIARAERLRWVSRALMGGVVLLNIILLIVSASLLGRQARRRAELTEQLANENEELERRVRRRTTELSALSSHLQQLSEKEKAALARWMTASISSAALWRVCARLCSTIWACCRRSDGSPRRPAIAPVCITPSPTRRQSRYSRTMPPSWFSAWCRRG